MKQRVRTGDLPGRTEPRYPLGVLLTRRQARQARRLLGFYQSELESAIDMQLAPNGRIPSTKQRNPVIDECRRRWGKAEDLVKALSSKLPGGGL